ncbi:FAD dependent oxidoreductase [Artomyces pyxidatus]|uniref:FAD dependent oxidoreductase n=1 Tax=Artomyces pyxidatus TaxID=48021 RepID=A0ACB8TH79_9AGAM|nr:FAD dependent oxidoreductase [Artomyces pyxidatus]
MYMCSRDPLLLSQFLLGECEARNVHVHHPVTATKVVADAGTNTLTGLTVRAADGTESTLPCDALLLTAGVWTPRVFSALFPRSRRALPITQLSGYSLVLRSPRWIKDSHMLPSPTGCHAAFTTDAAAGFAPEIFSRAGGDIYLAGLNTTAVPVPELATDVHPDDEAIAALAEVAKKLLGDDELDVVKTGLCHRPVTRSGAPLLARLASDDTGLDGEGVWVCAGHGPWGISMSLGTGLVLAELALGREPSADVSRLGL